MITRYDQGMARTSPLPIYPIRYLQVSNEMKVLLIFISIILISEDIQSQINDSLFNLTNQIKIEDYIWDPGTPYRLKSVEYDIQIQNDSLIVNEKSSDTSVNRNADRSTTSSTHKYKASVNDIGGIEFLNNLIIPKYGEPFYDSKIEIESLKGHELFESIYNDGTERKSWHIPIRVWRHSDSLKFKQIANLLNKYIKPKSNSVYANCIKDINHEWSGKEIRAIDNINLETPIYLNGEICTELAIQELTSNYLEEQNLKGILGYIVVSELNEIEMFWTEQNNFHTLLNSDNDLPFGYKTMIENIGVMTDEQLEKLIGILSGQNWRAGQCKNKSERSYFDIAIKNEMFKEPGDNKR